MTDRSSLTLARALHLARAGFVVFPCRRGEKRPATTNGLLDATDDEAQIERWFAGRDLNLAVACGPQPNGVNLFAIDVDPKNGGDSTWSALLNGHTVPPGPRHTTRSGGSHLFFDAPSDLHNTAGRLGVGIDTRGVGGYVVVPPSAVIDSETGEVGAYTTSRETALSQVPVPPLPTWICELLDESTPTVNGDLAYQGRSVSPLGDFGDSVADKAREGWRWEVELDRDGWTLARQRGDQQFWTRPGKSPRDGHSAVLHLPDGPLVVFTTEQPPGGVPTVHGEARSYSPWDYLVSYRAGGDTRRAAALVRGQPAVPVRGTSVVGGTGGDRVTDDDDTPRDEGPLNLPESFWTQRPPLAHILAAARSAGCSPA